MLATVFEIVALAISITFGVLLGYLLDYGILAVEFVYLGGIGFLFMEYHLYFKFGSGFAKYRHMIALDTVEDVLENKNEDIELILLKRKNETQCNR